MHRGFILAINIRVEVQKGKNRHFVVQKISDLADFHSGQLRTKVSDTTVFVIVLDCILIPY